MSDEHFIRECPNIGCHFCKEKGHCVRDCPKKILCDRCVNKEEECTCSVSELDVDNLDVNDNDSDSKT